MKIDWENELYDSSRKAIDRAASLVGSNSDYFKELYNLALEEKQKFSARASRVLYFSAEKHPDLVKPYIKQMINILPKLNNESVQRDFLRIFADCISPDDEEDLGRLINFCFDILNSITRQVSLKVYSLEILYKITKIEPELKKELAITIEKIMPYSSMAFASRGRRVLKKMNYTAQNIENYRC